MLKSIQRLVLCFYCYIVWGWWRKRHSPTKSHYTAKVFEWEYLGSRYSVRGSLRYVFGVMFKLYLLINKTKKLGIAIYFWNSPIFYIVSLYDFCRNYLLCQVGYRLFASQHAMHRKHLWTDSFNYERPFPVEFRRTRWIRLTSKWIWVLSV